MYYSCHVITTRRLASTPWPLLAARWHPRVRVRVRVRVWVPVPVRVPVPVSVPVPVPVQVPPQRQTGASHRFHRRC